MIIAQQIISSALGWRVLHGVKQYHAGIDYISGVNDRRVFAPVAGVITFDYDQYCHDRRFSEMLHSAGNMCILQPDEQTAGAPYGIRFLHLRENFISHGQHVPAGYVLGLYDDVGFSYGPHCHVDIQRAGQFIPDLDIYKKYNIT